MFVMSYKHKIRSNVVSWKKLSFSQRFSVVMMVAMLLIVPLSVYLVLNPKDVRNPGASTAGVAGGSVAVIEKNKTPTLSVGELKTAYVDKEYSASVGGYDQDISDGLSMSIKNLPPGLEQGKCRSSKNRRENVRELKCVIEGTPSFPGSYLIDVVLTDDMGGRASRTLTLQVN